MPLPPLPGTASLFAAKRGGELVALLIRFGFGELVVKTGLAKFLPAGLRPTPSTTTSPAPSASASWSKSSARRSSRPARSSLPAPT